MQKTHKIGIDLLRFFAACLVVGFHLGFFYLLLPEGYPHRILDIAALAPHASSFAAYGYIGVEIFFVISGYVISFSIEGQSRARYVRARFLRLWPTVWICATLCLLLAWLSHQNTLPLLIVPWLRSLVIMPQGPWIDGVYWTLPIEIAFYALIFFAGGNPAHRRALALVIGAISIGFWIGYAALESLPQFQHHLGALHYLAKSRALDLLLIHHGLYFALGILLHDPARKKIMLPFCTLALCAAFVEISVNADRLGGVVGVFIAPWNAYAIWIGAMLYLVAVLRYNAALVQALGQGGVRFLKTLGALTYPLYLIHVIVAGAAAYSLIRLGISHAIAWAAGPITAILAAAGVATWIEPAIRRLTGAAIDKVLPRKRAAVPPATVGQDTPLPRRA